MSARTRPPFPLIRHVSARVTPLLLRLPLTPNQITALALALGLAAAWMMAQGGWAMGVSGGVLLVLCYVFDNCDGEVARRRNQCTTFGMHFDSFVDWVVHASFFAALGIGTAMARGNEVWVWLGWIATAGCTINYAIAVRGMLKGEGGSNGEMGERRPRGWRERLVFAFRELARADFCFVALALSLFDAQWVLLPAAAVGAQAYWLTRFAAGAREFHV